MEIAEFQGLTALHRASMLGHKGIALMLLEKGAAINSVTKQGWTALKHACAAQHIEVAAMLIKRGADTTIGMSK